MQIAGRARDLSGLRPVHHPHEDLAVVDVFEEDPFAAREGEDGLFALFGVFTPAGAAVGVRDLRRVIQEQRHRQAGDGLGLLNHGLNVRAQRLSIIFDTDDHEVERLAKQCVPVDEARGDAAIAMQKDIMG